MTTAAQQKARASKNKNNFAPQGQTLSQQEMIFQQKQLTGKSFRPSYKDPTGQLSAGLLDGIGMNRQSEETKENLTISDNHYSSDNNANSGEEGQGFFAKI